MPCVVGLSPLLAALPLPLGCFEPSIRCRTNLSSVGSSSLALFPPPLPLHLPGACRGGAAGSAATERKRAEQLSKESRLLEGLMALLTSFQQEEQETGKGKGSFPVIHKSEQKGKADPGKGTGNNKGKNKGTGKGPQASPSQNGEGALLDALQRMVFRAQKKPGRLIQRLQNLLDAAIQGRKLGKKARKKTKRQAKTHGPPQDKAPEESPWLRVVKGKGVPESQIDRKHGGVFRLRASDWDGAIVVPSPHKLGDYLDKKKPDSKFVILIQAFDELSYKVLEIIHGDKAAKVKVIIPCSSGKPVQVEDFPKLSFGKARFLFLTPMVRL